MASASSSAAVSAAFTGCAGSTATCVSPAGASDLRNHSGATGACCTVSDGPAAASAVGFAMSTSNCWVAKSGRSSSGRAMARPSAPRATPLSSTFSGTKSPQVFSSAPSSGCFGIVTEAHAVRSSRSGRISVSSLSALSLALICCSEVSYSWSGVSQVLFFLMRCSHKKTPPDWRSRGTSLSRYSAWQKGQTKKILLPSFVLSTLTFWRTISRRYLKTSMTATKSMYQKVETTLREVACGLL
mmetsp:Transcript_20557/g.50320  ORF Transcript_20557/g.50320 Transcript_20557/m.50320 type:complete len:242 (-) Transcript_20557:354-1079(-)